MASHENNLKPFRSPASPCGGRDATETLSARQAQLLAEQEGRINALCNRMFAALFLVQWVAGISIAVAISPLTWIGATNSVHLHVWAAIFGGAALIAAPLFLIVHRPGSALTRQSIAVAQMLYSSLLIHLAGGRIETHFHVFGSLAFLAFYRDWRVLLTGTLVVMADHLLRGNLYARSVFGVDFAGHWRWLEHAGWVVFEDVFLVMSCFQGRREMDAIAHRQAALEAAKAATDHEVSRRTAELRASESRLQAAVDGTGVIVWEFDPTADAFTYLSPQALGLGYSSAESLAPHFWHSHVHPDDRDALPAKRDATVSRSQYRFIRADGSTVWIDDVTSPQRSTDARSLTRGVMIDITERKQLELSLTQAQRLESLGQLASGIAHEINTPVQYVGDNIRFVQTQFVGVARVLEKYIELMDPRFPRASWEERRAEANQFLQTFDVEFLTREVPAAIDQSLEGLNRMAQIVKAMKDFSHPSSKGKELADMNRAITSTIEVCRSRWEPAAEMSLELDPRLPLVPLHLGEFNQVVLNLVVNAADAIADVAGRAGRRGKIRVGSRRTPDGVELRVRDDGPGIPDKVRSRIFEPFFTTKSVGKGTGQGLTMSRNVIVKGHGGELFFEPSEGGGTTFVVRLPLPCDHTSRAEAA